MNFPCFHVNAFAGGGFRGNPAGVILLSSEWPGDETMRAVAAEIGFSETAFVTSQKGGSFGLRWFTPKVEVELCGHATLATAHVLLSEFPSGGERVSFETRSGLLAVEKRGNRYVLDFPARSTGVGVSPEGLKDVMGSLPREAFKARNLLLVYEREEDVRNLRPRFDAMRDWDCLGVIATAPGDRVDFVSRFFAPSAGVDEDPVTGSAHCTLVPYWAKALKRKVLHAHQISERGGELHCEDRGDRVAIGGEAVTTFRGRREIHL